MSAKESHFRTYKFRLLPTRKQHQALRRICESQRQLYNAALQERIDCYQKTGKGRGYHDQCKALTELRADPEFSSVPANLQRWTLRRVDEAYQAFFGRVMRGTKAGFPRFRGRGWWKSFGFNEPAGLRFDGHRIRFKGLPGGLRVHLHRPLPEDAEIKSCVFSRDLKGWNVCFQCTIPNHDLIHNGSAIGVTAGAAGFATLSTGEVIPRPHVARRVEKELRRRQRALARCKNNSVRHGKVRRKLMRMHETIRNGRRTFLHQHSAQLARRYRLIAIEEISTLSRTATGAAWGEFITMLTYKAESAGGEAIKVNRRGARGTCSTCGALLPRNSSATVVRCNCGSVVDRDRNAALNTLALAVTGQGQANVAADGQGTSS
jgi:putative transposase